jgi:hypothetical protein
MLREPRKTELTGVLKKDKKTGRFQIVKLEERIAPRFNPVGALVGPDRDKRERYTPRGDEVSFRARNSVIPRFQEKLHEESSSCRGG